MKLHKLFYYVFVITIIPITIVFVHSCSAQTQPTNLYDKYKNYTEEYILKQQSETFLPIPTPFGFVYDNHVISVAKLLYDNTGQENNSNAKVITVQQNKQAMQAMGNNKPPTQAEINAAQQNHLNGKTPVLTQQQQQQQQLSDILNEVNKTEPTASKYWKTPDFAKQTKPYLDAMKKLKEQLTGEKPLSVKDAYYEIENAYGNAYLSKKEYDDEINKSAYFIKQWLFENGYDLKNNIALHYGIQKFMSDTLTIGNKKNPEMPFLQKKVTHLPFYYDYQDYKAEKDFRSYHAIKTFATGNGQCHTLPIVYAILAEAIGAKFYLSYAPIHDFIKYLDNKGNINNYEVTSNWQISDQWYKDNLYVKSLAQEKRIYLDTLNQKEIVAGSLIELAYSYEQKLGVGDGKFINECVDFAMDYFPNKEANIYGWLTRSGVTSVKLKRLIAEKGIKTLSEIQQNQETKVLLDSVYMLNKKIESLGYEEIPETAYDSIVQNQDSKGKIQQLKQMDNLKKRKLFIYLNP